MDDLTENYLLLADAYWRMAQAAFPRGTITDVFFWEEPKSPRSPGRTANIALVGDAQRMSALFGMGLEEDAQAAPYLAPAIGRAVKSVMGVTTGHPSDWRDSELNLHDLLSRLSGQTSFQWADAHDLSIGDEIRVTFIPEPGWPWPTNDDRYWSARRKKWFASKKPDWVIMVPDPNSPSQMPAYGADPCRIFPPDETKTQPGGPVCGDLNGQKVIVTHAMQFLTSESSYKQIDVVTKGVKQCGGLLFPSLAVGPIPATNFGPIVLVAHLELVLDSLSPYRKRGRRPCWVYGTDAWTETTGSFLGDTAIELFDELHGYSDWLHRSMAILGISASSYGSTSGRWHDPLKSTKNLSTALKKAMRGWTPTLSVAQLRAKESEATKGMSATLKKAMGLAEFEAMTKDDAASKYAYLEAKAREVVRLDEFPFIVAPTFLRDSLTRFTTSLSYTGEVIFKKPAPWIEQALVNEEHEERDYALYAWAWEVADVVEGLRPVVKVLT